MFFLQNEAIIRRIESHLAQWRAGGAQAAPPSALRDAFAELQSGAAAAGFDDIAALCGGVDALLQQPHAGDDAQGLQDLLREIHEALQADFGFVPAQSREQIAALNALVTAAREDANPPLIKGAGGFSAGHLGARGDIQTPGQKFDDFSQQRGVPDNPPQPPLSRGGNGALDKGGFSAGGRGVSGDAQAAVSQFGGVKQEQTEFENSPGAYTQTPESGDMSKLRASPEKTPQPPLSRGGKGAPYQGGGELVTFDESLPQLQNLAADLSGAAGNFRLSFRGDGQVAAERRVAARVMRALEGLMRDSAAAGARQVRLAVAPVDGRLLLEYSDDATTVLASKDAAKETATQGGDSAAQAVCELGGLMAMQRGRDGYEYQFLLPATWPAARALLLAVGQYRFAVPAHCIARVLRPADVAGDWRGGFAADDMPVVDLNAQFGEGAAASPWLIVVRQATQMTALQADEVYDLIDIAGADASPQLQSIRGIAGGCILPDSSIAYLLQPDTFLPADARAGRVRFPLCDTDAGRAKTRVLALEVADAAVLLPAEMVAEVVLREDNAEAATDANVWVCGALRWRGHSLPVLDSAAIFGAAGDGGGDAAWRYAAVLWPLKGTPADAVFALSCARPPRAIWLDENEIAASDKTPTRGALGYVQIGERAGVIPDLHYLAREVLHVG